MVSAAGDVFYTLAWGPIQTKIARKELQARLIQCIFVNELSDQDFFFLYHVRKVVPFSDVKTAKLFNFVIKKRKSEIKQRLFEISVQLAQGSFGIKPDKLLARLQNQYFVMHQACDLRPYQIANKVCRVYYLLDNHSPTYLISETHLRLKIEDNSLYITTDLKIKRTCMGSNKSLTLYGTNLFLCSLSINDADLAGDKRVSLTPESIMIPPTLLPKEDEFTIRTVVKHESLKPWFSNARLLMSCEGTGMQKFTYFNDHHQASIQFSIEAWLDEKRFPVCLANGEGRCVAKPDGSRSHIIFDKECPIPPSSFAFVAGTFANQEIIYTTKSGRNISVLCYSNPEDLDDFMQIGRYAVQALQWLEKFAGLEYARDCVKLVALNSVQDLALSEQEGLLFFDRELYCEKIHSSPHTEFEIVRSIPRKLFHHFFGNVVRVDDAFMRAFKMGLIGYLEKRFMSEHFAKQVSSFEYSINDLLQFGTFADELPFALVPRQHVFGKMHHPGQFDSYSRHIFCMLETFFGESNMIKAIQSFFSKYEGKSAGYEEFFKELQKTSPNMKKEINFEQFSHWIFERPPPFVSFNIEYVPHLKEVTLKVTQSQASGKVFVIPITIAFYDSNGRKLVVPKTLVLTERCQKFLFYNIEADFVPAFFLRQSTPARWQFSDYSLFGLFNLLKSCNDVGNAYLMTKEFWRQAAIQNASTNNNDEIMRVNALALDLVNSMLENTKIKSVTKLAFLIACLNTLYMEPEASSFLYSVLFVSRDVIVSFLLKEEFGSFEPDSVRNQTNILLLLSLMSKQGLHAGKLKKLRYDFLKKMLESTKYSDFILKYFTAIMYFINVEKHEKDLISVLHELFYDARKGFRQDVVFAFREYIQMYDNNSREVQIIKRALIEIPELD